MNNNLNLNVQQPQPQMPAGQVPVMQPVAQKQPMDKATIMKYVGIGAGALIIVGMFLAVATMKLYGMESSVKIWGDDVGLIQIVSLLLGALTAVVYFFQKAKFLSLIASGWTLAYIATFSEAYGDVSGVSYGLGYYSWLIAGVAIVVLNVMENMDEIKGIFSGNKTVVAGAPAAVVPGQPMPQVVQPATQAVEVCKNCGQPKRNPADQFCQGCGQRY